MRVYFCLLLLGALLSGACSRRAQDKFPYRWVYASKNLSNASRVQEVGQIARTASEHGLNGILLSAGFDQLDL
ncbi:MAG: hypothetical protein JXQ83_14410, partial [Candidatus Glassbacteria bacterium]|nr:hypothetical protein [Candidatus Glassbacteria bacterium]